MARIKILDRSYVFKDPMQDRQYFVNRDSNILKYIRSKFRS